MVHRPKCKKQTIRPVGDNKGENLDVLEQGDEFLDITPRHDL